VAFDPDDLPASAGHVSVDPASAKTGTKLYDDTLKGKEWFNTGAFPEVTVDLSGFQTTSDGYVADAKLMVKGRAVDVPLGFALTIEGDVATLNGTAELSRKALDLGQLSDPNATTVADKVIVTVSGKATRKP
jgi:cytochrome b561